MPKLRRPGAILGQSQPESYSMQDHHFLALFDGERLRIHFIDITASKNGRKYGHTSVKAQPSRLRNAHGNAHAEEAKSGNGQCQGKGIAAV
jgi:hypothetical protein